jgi:hypothetical protein
MCCTTVIGLVLGLAGVAAAQEPGGFPGERMVTVTAGVGNAMGWFGVQGERYFMDEPDGPTFAAGLRSLPQA